MHRGITLGGLWGQFLVMATDDRELEPLEISSRSMLFSGETSYHLTGRSKCSTG